MRSARGWASVIDFFGLIIMKHLGHCRVLGIVLIGAASPNAIGQELATFDTEPETVGPNVGSQPRTARERHELGNHNDDDSQEEGEESGLGVWVSLGLEYTSAYFSRGFLFEDDGLILQSWADVGAPVWETDDVGLEVLLGVWNSWHDAATDSGTDDSFREKWYETDLYLGLGIGMGNWYFESVYYWYTSPSDAWESIQELYFSAAYDDSEAMDDWSMQPTAILAIETDNANDGYARGTYLQLGISPGFGFEEGSLEGLEITFPASVGLSVSNYYEGDDGENDFFGFASVGVTGTWSVPFEESWGDWSVCAGVQELFLGDTASSWNGDDETETVVTIGATVDF